MAVFATIKDSTTNNNNNNNNDDKVKRLLDQAAKIRAEIAAMEGKSVLQVEQEARDKKMQQERLEEEQKQKRRQRANSPAVDAGRFLEVPSTTQEMIRQAARAMERAWKDNLKRQTVRLALVKEGQSMTQVEEWPGGAQQMYREAAKPLTRELLREIRVSSSTTESAAMLPPVIQDQDVWDFDGSGIVTAKRSSGGNASHDDDDDKNVQALVFPNTDVKYLEDIDKMDQAMGDNGLFLLVNPFWRNVDTWGFNLLAPNAKHKAQEIIFDVGYNETYVLQRFSARGEQCVALKAYPYDWQLFAYREDDDYRFTGHETAIRLGSSKEEPTSAMFADLLNERPEFKLSRNMRQMKNMF